MKTEGIIIKIQRRESPLSKPYWQSFMYTEGDDKTVAYALDSLNFSDDLYDINDKSAPRIVWECGCLQKECGACAMVINSTPALACETVIKDVVKKRNNQAYIELKPLSKFNVIADLKVDRSIISNNLVKSEMWIDEAKKADKAEYEHQYSVAKCLKCGLCLEVCPNYGKGETFFGAVMANEAYLVRSQNVPNDHRTSVLKEYNSHFAAGCSKSLACADICPANIPTLASILSLNRSDKAKAVKIKK